MGFAYKATFTLTSNSSLLPSTQTDFPLLVHVTNIAFATVANGGQVINTTGFSPADLVFYADADLTVLLKFECLVWATATGEILYFVKIPTLSAGGKFYAGIGDATITTFQGDPENVWSDYKVVTHFANLIDSTANNNDGTNNGMTTTTGPIVQAWESDGTQNAFISGTSSIVTGQALTFSAIVKVTTALGVGLFCKTNTTDYDWMFYGSLSTTNYHLYVVTANGVQHVDSGIPYSDSAWTHLVGTYDGSNIRLYIDGDEIGDSPIGQTGDLQNSASSRVGWSDYLQVSGQRATAQYAETRVAAVARSADWIKIEYESVNDPATFVSVDTAPVGRRFILSTPLG